MHVKRLHGKRISAPYWPEPVRIISVAPVGNNYEVYAKLLDSGQLSEQVLTAEQVKKLLTQLGQQNLDGDPELFALGVEAHRIKLGYAFDPYFAVWASRVDPLPHQLEAVYGVLLKRPKVRYLLADDPGAGKTIMAGLFLKELVYRGVVKRILIVTPANLTDQWRRELKEKFNESFFVANRSTAEAQFGETAWEKYDRVITSIDFAKREPYIDELRHVDWDLVIVDEAHKLSATKYGKEIKRSQRYRLGEVLAERTSHLLFLTATPHQGNADKFRLLLDLLEPYLFANTKILEEAAAKGENPILLRRLKEDMTDFEGKPLFPPRHVHTPRLRLSPSERTLYDMVTQYVQEHFNRALDEKRRNVGLAMTVLQRRLASSTHAIARSLENRKKRLEKLLEEAREFKENNNGLEDINEPEVTSLEDLPEEERWRIEDEALKVTLARNLDELKAEVEELKNLAGRARTLAKLEEDTKLKELLRLLASLNGEKLLVFTEHKDTLHFLVEALEKKGYNVTFIEGGMRLEDRIDREREFRDSAQVMVATEAAGEGINLQFCSVMVNYDLPWNPTRLEQRMGRVHRYGQKYEVHIYNLVAEGTREGDVLRLLLEKLEAMRLQLGSDRVYDVVGELMADVNLEQLIFEHIAGRKSLADIRAVIGSRLDPVRIERIKEITLEALAHREINLSQLREDLQRSKANRLEPEYTERFFARAIEMLGGSLEKKAGSLYQLRLPYDLSQKHSLKRSWPKVTFDPAAKLDAELLAPGNKVFDAVLGEVLVRSHPELAKGATLQTVHANKDTLAGFIQLGVKNGLGQVVSRKLLALADEQGEKRFVPPNILVDAQPAPGPMRAPDEGVSQSMRSWLYENYVGEYIEQVANEQRRTLEIKRKYGLKSLGYLISESAKRLAELKLRQTKGEDVELPIKNESRRLQDLKERKQQLEEELERAEELAPEIAEIIAIAGLVPAQQTGPDEDDPAVRQRVEEAAMRYVFDHEHAQGREPRDVSQENLGYDIESSGRYIEVKGRARVGSVALTPNEWFTARHLGDDYYLYIVINALTNPSLYIVQNPASKLRPGQEVGVVRYVVPWKDWRRAAKEVGRDR